MPHAENWPARHSKHQLQNRFWLETNLLSNCVLLSADTPYLGAPHADDPVHVACGIVEIGDSQGVLAGGDPVPFGGGIDLENVGPGAEDWLLPARETNGAVRAEGKLSNGGGGLKF